MGCSLRRTTGIHEVEAYNISYVIVSNRCGARDRSGCLPIGGASSVGAQAAQPPPRNLFYDLGCASYGPRADAVARMAAAKAQQWNTSLEDAERRVRQKLESPTSDKQGAAMGPSIPLFRSLYRRNCIEFDHIYGWEYKRMADWWERVPASLRSAITFYNEAVNASDASALGVLLRTARPQDFVVLKLDIDTPEIENPIIEAIASRPELSALVDELFFEYHSAEVNYRMYRKASRPATMHTTSQAVSTMTRLRRLGIRSHFWV